jgi:hypothetical protein
MRKGGDDIFFRATTGSTRGSRVPTGPTEFGDESSLIRATKGMKGRSVRLGPLEEFKRRSHMSLEERPFIILEL